jgi:hypothetical protein
MDIFLGTFAAAAGTLAFFGGIALCMWVDQRGKWRQRELENAERMKALEQGLPLPDAEIARAEAEKSRARAAGAVGVLVPLFTLAASVGSTAIVLAYQKHSETPIAFATPRSTAPLVTIWVVCGVIVTAALVLSIRNLRRSPALEAGAPKPGGHGMPPETPRGPVLAEFAPGSAAFKERT